MLRRLWLGIVCLGLLPLQPLLLGQGMPSPEVRAALEAAVDEGVGDIVSGPLLQAAKATYLEEYGVVVTVEVALERPRNPFSSTRSPNEVRQSTEGRRQALREVAVNLVEQHVSGLDSLSAEERMTIVIYMLNTNPVDLPDLPTQLVVSGKKRDLVGPGDSTSAPERVSIREY